MQGSRTLPSCSSSHLACRLPQPSPQLHTQPEAATPDHTILFRCLQARGVAEGIVASVSLMQDSGLPCFGRGRPIPNLRQRFHLEMSEREAAAFFRRTILDAYDKVGRALLAA